MLSRILSGWFRFGSDRPGFFTGTLLLLTLMLLIYAGGVQASLSLGPEGDFPRFRDVFLFALSHDDPPSLLVSVLFLLLVGPCEERRWGTVAFLSLSALTTAVLPCFYTLVLFVGDGKASRVCGYSAVQLALLTAQCRQVTRRRLLRCVPVWVLPWLLLLLGLLLLPGTPALLHFCAICIGHNYHLSFIGTLQELEHTGFLDYIPDWAFIKTTSRLRLPTYNTSHSCSSQTPHTDEAVPPGSSGHSRFGTAPVWALDRSGVPTEAQLLEEQMLRAGILASLQEAPDASDAKVEVSKSSVSSLRLQQLERMGFPTEKAVVALAASKQLEGAVSLLIDDRVGEQTVVVGAKALVSPQSS